MPKTKRKTKEFKERQCGHCELADKKELRQRRPNFCKFKKETGKDPDIRNGHCSERKPTKKG